MAAFTKPGHAVTAVWLEAVNGHVFVRLEIEGRWIEVIHTCAEVKGVISHIVESGGILKQRQRGKLIPRDRQHGQD